jgi:Tfp pilus assembly protein PilN
LIEINLLPGSAKRARTRRMPKLAMGGLGSKLKLPKFDRPLALTVGAWVVGLGLLAWMFVGGRTKLAALEDEIEAETLRAVTLKATMATRDSLQKRMAVVAGKLNVVQDIDGNRYVWAHLLDEIARAIPEHTWLEEIHNLVTDSGVKNPHFSVEGRTGNNLALAQYLAQLEQSPFIQNVRMKTSELVREDNKWVYSFQLEADYQAPPPDVLETVPLFTRAELAADSAAQPAGRAGAAGRGTTSPQRGTAAPQRGTTPPSRGTAPPRTTSREQP